MKDGNEPPVRFSERKASAYTLPWSIEEIVTAQQLDAGGAEIDAIADALQRPVHEVKQKLGYGGAPRALQTQANVGFASMKGRG